MLGDEKSIDRDWEPGAGQGADAKRGGSLALPESGNPGSGAFNQLDPRVVSLWRVLHLITFAVVLAGLIVSAVVMALETPGASPWVFVALIGFAGVLLWISVQRPGRLYKAWGYRIDRRVLETRSGIIFKVIRLLPLSRLQHVDLHRGPLERTFGLASLVLHTAGTHEATITIPGLDADEAVRLRDHLVEIGGDDAV